MQFSLALARTELMTLLLCHSLVNTELAVETVAFSLSLERRA